MSGQENEEWKELKEELNIALLQDAQRARLLAKETYLKVEDVNPKHFFRALDIKKRQGIIQSFKDAQGKWINNPNQMVEAMISFLGEIILAKRRIYLRGRDGCSRPSLGHHPLLLIT